MLKYFLSRLLPGNGIQAQQLGIVIKHFLKMRHPPFCIDRIAGKAAPELIMYATQSDFLQTMEGHLPRLCSGINNRQMQKVAVHARHGKFWRLPESAPIRIVAFQQCLHAGRNDFFDFSFLRRMPEALVVGDRKALLISPADFL